ncbi:MAG TPA: CRTAC1 family protein [Bryobacteraceae bacterium]|nr:CRTAC1 family protein [Bryobacteraceae bacterium]
MRLRAWQVVAFAGLAAAVTAMLGGPVDVLPRFVDVTRQAGIHFRHENAASPQKFMIETMGAGCAWIDYNRDGLLDLYLVNGAETVAFKPAKPLASALYRNNGDGTFTDVTASSHVGAEGLFGMGVAVGDYDNDGYPDLMVLGYGRSILYHNNGDGTFTDVTARAGVANAGKWASSAAWFDYDNDGRLDLAIANYVDWTPERNSYCGAQGPGLRSYCHPDDYHGTAPTLYHNNGDGTFSDVSQSSGLAKSPSNGLGIVTLDYDGDGRQDILIANDGRANSLFHNNGDSTFTEAAYEAGVAVGEDGTTEAGMGIDAADASGKGWPDFIVTHLDQQQTRFYRGLGHGMFEDATAAARLAYATFQFSGFGVRFVDFDNDGWPDIFIASGHVLDNIDRYHAGVSWAEPKLVFRNMGRGIFADLSRRLGPDLQTPTVSRGLAAGDYDNDGDMDILVSNNGGAPQLLRNDGGNANHWLEILLIGTRSNRDGVGARLKLTAGDWSMTAQRMGGMSYQSAQDPRLHFGLGSRTKVDALEVRWPSGIVTRLASVAANQILTIQEK